jgi:hypothetical protein
MVQMGGHRRALCSQICLGIAVASPQGGAPVRNRLVGANKSNFTMVFVGDISIVNGIITHL